MRTIRTQGKRCIAIAEKITTVGVSLPEYDAAEDRPLKLLAYFQGDDHCVLGEYATDQRRVRVLDALEEWLSLRSGNRPVSSDEYATFEMPDDSNTLDA